MKYIGALSIIRNFPVSFRNEQERVTETKIFVGGMVQSYDGWLVNYDKDLSIIHKTTINGFHQYILHEKSRCIKTKSIQRMTYNNCYLGLFIESFRCAVPFTPDYFKSINKHEKGLFVAESVSILSKILIEDLCTGDSPYSQPTLGREYREWLDNISSVASVL